MAAAAPAAFRSFVPLPTTRRGYGIHLNATAKVRRSCGPRAAAAGASSGLIGRGCV